MKAAVLEKLGTAPVYKEAPDPVIENEDQLLLHVKAAAVKNLDKGRAAGTHYASYKTLPAVVGMDCVGVLENGALVYAQGISGTIAEKVLIHKNQYVPLPATINAAAAAALPNAALGSLLAFIYRAKLQKGQTVLINGATGVTGMMAVQVAKLLGAQTVIATGRNETQLQKLIQLGADEILSLKQEDDVITARFKELYSKSPVDVVIDYLWGHPASLILKALQGEGMHQESHPLRFVTVGSMAGDELTVSSNVLRSSDIELLGSGFGSLSPQHLKAFSKTYLPELFEKAAEGKLAIEVETAPLKDVEQVWDRRLPSGKRLVIVMD